MKDLVNKIGKTPLLPCNPHEVLEGLFPKHYDSLEGTITKSDMDRLGSYKDQDIRDKLARILLQSDIVPAAEKTRIDDLSTRPHSGYEISDFEIEVQLEDSRYRVDFVIKSAAEKKNKLNEADLWYQISRPLDRGSDLVVLISYADLTIPLKNTFRRHGGKARYIVGKELALLFKNYSELD